MIFIITLKYLGHGGFSCLRIGTAFRITKEQAGGHESRGISTLKWKTLLLIPLKKIPPNYANYGDRGAF